MYEVFGFHYNQTSGVVATDKLCMPVKESCYLLLQPDEFHKNKMIICDRACENRTCGT